MGIYWLLLTIAGTFIEVSVTNLPWDWSTQGLETYPLGITYQIGAVLLTGCLGGPNAGALSQIAYVILGLKWLPVFAQGGGLAYFQQLSFGYILGFIPGAWLCGFLAFRFRTRLEWLFFSAFSGLVLIHLFGLLYLSGLSFFTPAAQSSFPPEQLLEAMKFYSLDPLGGQLLVLCAVAVIAFFLRKLLFY